MTEFKHIKGGAELQAFLDKLPAKIEANIMRSALRQGANVLKAEIKQTAPVDDGDLRASVRVSTRSKRGTVTASVKVGNKKAWYAHIIEYTGAVQHVIRAKNGKMLAFGGGFYRSVNHPGMKAKPFIRPALDSKANAAIEAVGEQIRKRLTKEGLDAPVIEVQ